MLPAGPLWVFWTRHGAVAMAGLGQGDYLSLAAGCHVDQAKQGYRGHVSLRKGFPSHWLTWVVMRTG